MPHGAQHTPPPLWLQDALQELREENPRELFEATVGYRVIDQNTLQSVKLDSLSASAVLPPGYKAQYLPRIRCFDCQGRLYFAGPEHTVDNFQVHVENRLHRANLQKRTV
ncbi:hypothetical protein K432DRAFT_313867 [Lepidopterella palustris CBS 459.81]|uniref:Uncharacterized protein n=1 Tax=Lepidopterella palustris CBS 459.81 TaxID=1314670 RepID=A0A8E2DWY5_9PEZI|nr:hypothetical protein K432DRAFT_313867 [Lepidopterella palustris CBS 459.81]